MTFVRLRSIFRDFLGILILIEIIEIANRSEFIWQFRFGFPLISPFQKQYVHIFRCCENTKSLSDIALNWKIYSPIVFIIGCCQHIAKYDLMYFFCPWCWIHDWNQNKPRENLIPCLFSIERRFFFWARSREMIQRNKIQILEFVLNGGAVN